MSGCSFLQCIFEFPSVWCTYSAVCLLHGCCHLSTFCVHHTTTHHVTSLHAKSHTTDTCMCSCNLPPTLLAEWPGLFPCYCSNTGWNVDWNKSQHRKLTLKKKIILPLQLGLEPMTFQSWVWHSNHWSTPGPRMQQNITVLTAVSTLPSLYKALTFSGCDSSTSSQERTAASIAPTCVTTITD